VLLSHIQEKRSWD